MEESPRPPSDAYDACTALDRADASVARSCDSVSSKDWTAVTVKYSSSCAPSKCSRSSVTLHVMHVGIRTESRAPPAARWSAVQRSAEWHSDATVGALMLSLTKTLCGNMGSAVGSTVVGSGVGSWVGVNVGERLGTKVGIGVGTGEGFAVGASDGVKVGR